MSERYTRHDAERAFRRLVGLLGATRTKHWRLDYAPLYGGFRVECEPPGHPIYPLGNTRRKAREFCDAVNFAAAVLDVRRDG